jgi:hypothetical protein
MRPRHFRQPIPFFEARLAVSFLIAGLLDAAPEFIPLRYHFLATLAFASPHRHPFGAARPLNNRQPPKHPPG